jgi:hypothetical protein
MTNNKRKYGNDKFQSGPLSDQPEINTGLLPGSQEIYVESNVDKSTKSSFLKDIPNWLKWLLLAALLLLAFWVWNNFSNNDSVAVIESTTTTVVSESTATTVPLIDSIHPGDRQHSVFSWDKESWREHVESYIPFITGTNKKISDLYTNDEIWSISSTVCMLEYGKQRQTQLHRSADNIEYIFDMYVKHQSNKNTIVQDSQAQYLFFGFIYSETLTDFCDYQFLDLGLGK